MQQMLAQLVHEMRGRPLEEGDWKGVYCAVKGIPDTGWSNLPFGDINHNGIGVEQKQIKKESKPTSFCGTSIMHPAATRSIRIDSSGDAEEQKASVLNQYGDLIETFRAQVREKSPGVEPDVRSGWLIYQNDLAQFMYFEESLVPPNPEDFVAEWNERRQGGTRKASRNLWIYEKDRAGRRGQKRYSVTTDAGAKIQPYVDIPALGTPGLYVFDVFDAQTEIDGEPRAIIWALESTVDELDDALSGAGFKTLDDFLAATPPAKILAAEHEQGREMVEPLLVDADAYAKFRALGGTTDQERLERIIRFLKDRA